MLGTLTLLLAITTTPALMIDEPFDLTGSWAWDWKDQEGNIHRHVMEVKRRDQGYVAVERFDDKPPVPVKDLEIRGKAITFEILRGVRTTAYQGEIADPDTINGEVTVMAGGESEVFAWTAKRVVERPEPEPEP